MTSQPKTCGECRVQRAPESEPRAVTLCPRHASAEKLYEAAVRVTKADAYARSNPLERAAAISQLHDAIDAYEGK